MQRAHSTREALTKLLDVPDWHVRSGTLPGAVAYGGRVEVQCAGTVTILLSQLELTGPRSTAPMRDLRAYR
jgi:hypothetical protein